MADKLAIIYRPHGLHIERDEHMLHLSADDVAVMEAALYDYVKNTNTNAEISALHASKALQVARDETARADSIREFLSRFMSRA